MRWCWFKLQLFLRMLFFVTTHTSWILIIALNCAYFQMWKSYDVFWYWVHVVLSLVIPTMRQGNIFLTVYLLIKGKIAEPSMKLQEIFYQKVCAKTEFKDAPTHNQSWFTRFRFLLCCCCQEPRTDVKLPGDEEADVEMNQFPSGKTLEPDEDKNGAMEYAENVKTPKIPRTQWGPINLKTIPAAVDMAIWLYRFRVTVALIVGNTRQAIMRLDPPEPLFNLPTTTTYKKKLWQLSMVALYMDIALIWYNIIQIYCRQCRMCCTVGVCRCMKYTMIMVVIGVLVMEWPMWEAHSRLDGTLCSFIKES